MNSKYYNKQDYIDRLSDPTIHSHFFNVQSAYISLFLREIYKFTGKRKLRILDFGCAYGVKAKLIAEHGHEVIGYDIAKEHTLFASERYNIKTFSGDWKQVKDFIGEVDVIFTEHVLEHIPDPLVMLLSIKENLKKNGIVYISVPNFDSLQVGYLPPDHLQYFNKNSIKALMMSADLNICSLYRGFPCINFIYKHTGRLPFLPVIHAVDKTSSLLGFNGYSLRIYASK